MKKYFIIAMAFVAGIAMTSCKHEGNDPVTDAQITFAKQSLELGVGDTERLTVTITPAGTSLNLKYASSNAAVATVGASGIVTGVAEGEAMIIVSADGAKGDTCYVTVSNNAVYNQFNIAGWSLFGSEWTFIEGTKDTLEFSDGTKYVCQLAEILLVAWDGNLVYSKGWSGAGLAIQAPVTFYVIVDDLGDGSYNGYYIGHGGFEIKDLAGVPAHGCAQAGSVNVNDYGEFLKGYIVAETSEDVNWDLLETAFPGAQIVYADYSDAENPSWSDSYGRYYGHVVACDFYEADEDAGTDAAWALQMKWHDFIDDDRYFGMKVTLDDQGYLASVVEPFDFKEVERTFYSDNWEDVTSSAHKKQIKSPATINKEVPAFAKHLDTHRLYKK